MSFNFSALKFEYVPITAYYNIIDVFKDKQKYSDIKTFEEIKKRVSKDTVFIFGCGYSINDLSDQELIRISSIGDTFSFNYFFKGEVLPIDYHICGEIAGVRNFENILCNKQSMRNIDEYYEGLNNNSFYDKTVFFLRYKKNNVVMPVAAYSYFNNKSFKNKSVCLYGIKKHQLKMGLSINSISHYSATLSDAVNISYLLGYKKIVLIGIDLYDRRYYFLKYNEKRKIGSSDTSIDEKLVSTDRMIYLMNRWKDYLSNFNKHIYIYNPKSLLNEVLDVYVLE